MNDVLPPKRPLSQPKALDETQSTNSSQPLKQKNDQATLPENSIDALVSQASLDSIDERVIKKKSLGKRLLAVFGGLLLLVGVLLIATFFWYQDQLRAVDPGSKQQVRVEIASGMGPSSIASLLEEKGLIKNKRAFDVYIRLERVENRLQAGQYMLGKGMTVKDIVAHLKKGQLDTFRLTLYPGAVLRDNTNIPENKKTDVTTVLKRAGYSTDEIEAALKAQYDHPVLATKPASADLEGYIYGETYEFASAASAEDVIRRSLDELYKVVNEKDLIAKYKKQGLTLYEGITLASIVQREVNGLEDQKKVAGVFYNRIKVGMMLGSDVTYQYAADKTGQQRSPDLESPYNTRKYTGLPPGPIAAPGESALLAVAEPATNDYLFFLSGDDDNTYFGRTQAEHEQNIQQHCQQKCLIL